MRFHKYKLLVMEFVNELYSRTNFRISIRFALSSLLLYSPDVTMLQFRTSKYLFLKYQRTFKHVRT